MSNLKRWPIIRHIRWAIADYRVWNQAIQFGRMGIGFGVPHDTDLAHLNAIWKGEA